MYARNYTICGVRVGIRAPEPLERLERLLVSHFGASGAGGGRRGPGIALWFCNTPPSGDPGVELYRSAHLAISARGERCTVRCGESVLEIDPTRNRAAGFLDHGFAEMPAACQRVFLFLPLLTLLPRLGLYGVHAGGVVDGGAGYLIAGDSKHGKTTLSMALVAEGWHYLSDDTVMLRASSGGVEALPFRRGFACDEETAARYPWLAGSAGPVAWPTGKVLLDIERAYPGRRLERCVPRVVLFSEIGGQARTELLPLDQTGAFTRLVRHSPFTLQSAAAVRRHVRILQALVSQALCCRLRLGADVYGEPAAVSRLLRAIRDGRGAQDRR